MRGQSCGIRRRDQSPGSGVRVGDLVANGSRVEVSDGCRRHFVPTRSRFNAGPPQLTIGPRRCGARRVRSRRLDSMEALTRPPARWPWIANETICDGPAGDLRTLVAITVELVEQPGHDVDDELVQVTSATSNSTSMMSASPLELVLVLDNLGGAEFH